MFNLRIIALVFCTVLSGFAYGFGAAGCGLGSLIISANGKLSQLFASTTNATFGSQSFGITTGTSNCNARGFFGMRQKQKDFIVANFSTLERESAQGTGKSLEGLASLMGCQAQNYSEFGSVVQSNYQNIFANKDPASTLAALHEVLLLGSEQLATQCAYVAI